MFYGKSQRSISERIIGPICNAVIWRGINMSDQIEHIVGAAIGFVALSLIIWLFGIDPLAMTKKVNHGLRNLFTRGKMQPRLYNNVVLKDKKGNFLRLPEMLQVLMHNGIGKSGQPLWYTAKRGVFYECDPDLIHAGAHVIIHIGKTFRLETIVRGEASILYVELPTSDEILAKILKSEISR
jgi:hypothetical protein